MDDAITGADQLVTSGAQAGALEQWVCAQYEEFGPGLRRYLVRLLGDPALADDLVQEVFLRLYEERLKHHDVRRLRPWIFQVGHNLAIDEVRRRGQDEWALPGICLEATADQTPSAEAAMLHAERRRQVRDGLYLLSAQERQVLELRAEGLVYREIAGLMGLQVSTVATFLTRAVNKIARQIRG